MNLDSFREFFIVLFFELINTAGKGQLTDHSLAGRRRDPLEACNQQIYKELQLSPRTGGRLKPSDPDRGDQPEMEKLFSFWQGCFLPGISAAREIIPADLYWYWVLARGRLYMRGTAFFSHQPGHK
jgi:hypothetical protein